MLLEKFEVVLRTAEDCKWILAEEEGLPGKITIDKLCVRLGRIENEINIINAIVNSYQ